MSPPVIAGFSEIRERYDAAFVDLWGTVHNGVRPYPGVLDCLARMRDGGLRVLLLTNAARLHSAVARQLEGLGVPADCADGIVTAGDVTVQALNEAEDAWHARLGTRFYHLGNERSASALEEVEGESVALADADYVLLTGLVDDSTETVEDYGELLARIRARALPMVCANPDRVVVRGERTIFCAGALADAYEALGGEVRRHGKPFESIFRRALARLDGIAGERTVMIGDSFSTDIAGAVGVGIDSLWLAGGIHAAEVGYSEGVPLDPVRLAGVLDRAPALPTLIAPRLGW
ncbi:MAG: TIGR01459 family HAD-type hydrolase [Alphaproteobacteria bacterium]|jgi:HAD superfamily hydrolase (TIGR01459 family)|nr:TIGR01459 family HAD-type hydrolase [Alphaproteobacteria bacterium]